MDNYQMLDLFLNQDLAANLTQQTASLPMAWAQAWTPMFAADASLVEQWGTRLYNIMLVALGLGFVIFVHELDIFLLRNSLE